MKNILKKIKENKFQFFFFVGLLALLLVALVVSNGPDKIYTPDDTPIIDNPVKDPNEDIVTETVEVISLPYNDTVDFVITRKFYEKNDSKENQEMSLIKYNNTYRISDGTAYSRSDNSSFQVQSILSGTVSEVKNNPLFGSYVVITHDDDVKSYYYGLSEIKVEVGSSVAIGDVIGVSGTTEIDKAAGNHVFLKIKKNDRYYNPEKLIGKKVSEIQ